MSAARVGWIAAPLLLVVGVLAILLASDVRSWRDVFHDDALAYSIAPKQPVRMTAETTLPAGVSKTVLGVDENRRWLNALRQFRIAYDDVVDVGLNALGRSDYILLHRGEAALRRVTQGDPARASEAYDLLGVLVFREAFSAGTDTDPNLVQQSVTDLQNAVRLDPRNEPAKENLELGLRVLSLVQRIQQGRAAGSTPRVAHQGGYGGPPGSGY